MSLSDFVGHLSLTAWAEAAMGICVTIFVGVLLFVLFSRKERMDRMAHMPFEEGNHE